MSRLLSAQTTKHDGKRDFCLKCLNGFAFAESLAKHREYWKIHPVAKRDLPKPENATLQFKNLNYSMRVPYIVYIAFTKPVHTSQPNPEHSYTKRYQKHIPSSFSRVQFFETQYKFAGQCKSRLTTTLIMACQ